MGSFRPKSVGRRVGRKFGVLYDEYAKYKALSAWGFNKAEKSIVASHAGGPRFESVRAHH